MLENRNSNPNLNPDSNLMADLPFDKGGQLTYVQRGVLWVQKKPHYIVELVKEPTINYVIVYRAHEGEEHKKSPKKYAIEKVKKVDRYTTSTTLAQIANKLFPSKKTKYWEVQPPLFVAPVIPNRKATLTGKIENGFFEREPDRVTSVGGEVKLVRGRNTNVFIGMSSIEWEEKVSIPTQSIIKTLMDYKNDSFFDLEGDNDNTNNPLSTYYKEGR